MNTRGFCRHCAKPPMNCDCTDDSGFQPVIRNPPLFWRGIFKLQEEMGEVQQVLGKIGPFPNVDHPDGMGDLVKRLEDELADVAAASRYLGEMNGLDVERMRERAQRKYEQFKQWGLTGINPFPEQP